MQFYVIQVICDLIMNKLSTYFLYRVRQYNISKTLKNLSNFIIAIRKSE